MDVDWTQSFALARHGRGPSRRSSTRVVRADARDAWRGAGRRSPRGLAEHAARVRPAIIFEVTLHGGSINGSVDRFLDTDWRDHPAGQAGAIMLASALAERAVARWPLDRPCGSTMGWPCRLSRRNRWIIQV